MYNGKWLDSFEVRIATDEDRPGAKGKVLLKTPHVDYLFNPEQWSEFKEKVNEV